ncbi:MAG TPA: hypothetical protein VGM06_18005 [Polyangiaceae bacterium]
MAGLGALATVRGSFTLNGLASLQNVSGLGALTTVGSPGAVASLYIASNPALTDVTLAGLQTVTGAIGFESDQALTDAALPALTSVGTSGLPDGFSGSLVFNVLATLNNVDLRSLATTPSNVQFSTIGSQALGSMTTNFASLTTVNGTLNFTSVANLENMIGFGALATVRGSFTLNTLGMLANVAGLDALATVGAPGAAASLYIANNATLTDVTLSALQTVTGAIGFESDQGLTNAALPALTSVGTAGLPDGFSGSLLFNVLPNLTNVDLPDLASTPSNVQVSTCGAKAAAHLVLDLSALTTDNGFLFLSAVTNLFDLNGLAELVAVCGSVTITTDTNLPTSTASGLLAQLASVTCKGTPTTISGDQAD